MCTKNVLAFVDWALRDVDTTRWDFLEVGSRNVNGTPRDIPKTWTRPYVGIDSHPGPGVDIVMRGEDLLDRFAPESFDCVISTEMLEHAEHWRTIVTNMMTVLKTGGLLIITTRSPGFPEHAYPDDWWRFTVLDFANIFKGWPGTVHPDTYESGVFVRCTKPEGWEVPDLKWIKPYSMKRARFGDDATES